MCCQRLVAFISSWPVKEGSLLVEGFRTAGGVGLLSSVVLGGSIVCCVYVAPFFFSWPAVFVFATSPLSSSSWFIWYCSDSFEMSLIMLGDMAGPVAFVRVGCLVTGIHIVTQLVGCAVLTDGFSCLSFLASRWRLPSASCAFSLAILFDSALGALALSSSSLRFAMRISSPSRFMRSNSSCINLFSSAACATI